VEIDEGTSEELHLEKVVELVLERQLPAVMARWAPFAQESETRPSLGTGSKLHIVTQFLSLEMTSGRSGTHRILGCAGGGELASW